MMSAKLNLPSAYLQPYFSGGMQAITLRVRWRTFSQYSLSQRMGDSRLAAISIKRSYCGATSASKWSSAQRYEFCLEQSTIASTTVPSDDDLMENVPPTSRSEEHTPELQSRL